MTSDQTRGIRGLTFGTHGRPEERRALPGVRVPGDGALSARVCNRGGPCPWPRSAAGTGREILAGRPMTTRRATATPKPRKAVKPIKVCAKAFAEILEVDRVTVWRWMGEGMPVLRRRGGEKGAHEIDLVAAFRWLRARDKAMADEALEALRSTPELDELRRRKLAAEARLAEVTLAEREAALIPAADIGPRWERLVIAARERFLSTPALAVQRGLITPEHEDGITDLVHEALAELSAGETEAAA